MVKYFSVGNMNTLSRDRNILWVLLVLYTFVLGLPINNVVSNCQIYYVWEKMCCSQGLFFCTILGWTGQNFILLS